MPIFENISYIFLALLFKYLLHHYLKFIVEMRGMSSSSHAFETVGLPERPGVEFVQQIYVTGLSILLLCKTHQQKKILAKYEYNEKNFVICYLREDQVVCYTGTNSNPVMLISSNDVRFPMFHGNKEDIVDSVSNLTRVVATTPTNI